MDINTEDETSYTTQYQEAILMDVENECCAKHRQWSVINHDNVRGLNLFPSAKASKFGQSSVEP